MPGEMVLEVQSGRTTTGGIEVRQGLTAALPPRDRVPSPGARSHGAGVDCCEPFLMLGAYTSNEAIEGGPARLLVSQDPQQSCALRKSETNVGSYGRAESPRGVRL